MRIAAISVGFSPAQQHAAKPFTSRLLCSFDNFIFSSSFFVVALSLSLCTSLSVDSFHHPSILMIMMINSICQSYILLLLLFSSSLQSVDVIQFSRKFQSPLCLVFLSSVYLSFFYVYEKLAIHKFLSGKLFFYCHDYYYFLFLSPVSFTFVDSKFFFSFLLFMYKIFCNVYTIISHAAARR